MAQNRGYNTFHGHDSGPPPPSYAPIQPHQPSAPSFQTLIPSYGGFWGGWAAQPAPLQFQCGMPAPAWAPPPQQASGGGNERGGGTGGLGTFKNHLGGTGLPPNYNYIYPTRNTAIHVLKTAVRPWQLTTPMYPPSPQNPYPSPTIPFTAYYVPTNTTIKALMQNLGCTNEVAKKNRLYEISEMGGGRWTKGLEIGGEMGDRVKKTVGDMGWDEGRDGSLGGKPVVWLWLTKEG
ncbi:hypothetical protein BJ875DRAFT_467216 [Amylocarpus encephaloides]|uniref:Uncharacterized protein n=1 Tax=Amylocarpus encephaloides TaxID=45428 RepID=A0A9P8C392_9HELO|nr:hypothetical protein BJ875DRAFT_467216 [Amylocarpus encephaloides]